MAVRHMGGRAGVSNNMIQHGCFGSLPSHGKLLWRQRQRWLAHACGPTQSVRFASVRQPLLFEKQGVFLFHQRRNGRSSAGSSCRGSRPGASSTCGGPLWAPALPDYVGLLRFWLRLCPRHGRASLDAQRRRWQCSSYVHGANVRARPRLPAPLFFGPEIESHCDFRTVEVLLMLRRREGSVSLISC